MIKCLPNVPKDKGSIPACMKLLSRWFNFLNKKKWNIMKPNQTRVGAPEGPPICRETQSLGQQMLNTPVGIKGLRTVGEAVARKLEKNEEVWKGKVKGRKSAIFDKKA